jgi:hypothetical protein
MPKGFSFSKEEVDSFLDTVEEYLPISLTARKRVAEVHLMRYPNLNRTVNNLKSKFKELHNNKIPTGDPLCPPAVHRAKHLRVEIINRLDASDLNYEEGDNSLEEGDATTANLRRDCEGNEVEDGLEEEDDFSIAVVGEDSSTVVGGDEGVDDAATLRPSSQASVSSSSGLVAVPLLPPRNRQSSQSAAAQRAAMVFRTNSTTSGRQLSSSAYSANGRHPPTHMTPLSQPWT